MVMRGQACRDCRGVRVARPPRCTPGKEGVVLRTSHTGESAPVLLGTAAASALGTIVRSIQCVVSSYKDVGHDRCREEHVERQDENDHGYRDPETVGILKQSYNAQSQHESRDYARESRRAVVADVREARGAPTHDPPCRKTERDEPETDQKGFVHYLFS